MTIKIQELTHRKDIYETKNLALRREGERAKEREKKIDGNDEKAKKTTGRNTKDEGS